MDLKFIKTVKHPKGWVAMFVDKDVVGASGVEAIRSASKIPSIFNTIRTREGVHFFDKKAMWEKVKQFRELIQKNEKAE